MKNFSLLSSLKNTVPKKPVNESTIQYDEYSITLHDNKEKTVFIPVRESVGFETALNATVLVTEGEIKKLLRKFNGVVETK